MPDENKSPIIIPVPNKPRLFFLLIITLVVILVSIIAFVIAKRFLEKAPTPSPPAKITIPCPSIPQFCQQKKPVSINNNYIGIGASIKPSSPIFAVFDGRITRRSFALDQALGGEKFIQLELTNTVNDKVAYYYVKNIQKNIPSIVKEGQQIATSSADTINYFNNYSLVFSLTDKKPEDINNRIVPIEQIDFK